MSERAVAFQPQNVEGTLGSGILTLLFPSLGCLARDDGLSGTGGGGLGF